MQTETNNEYSINLQEEFSGQKLDFHKVEEIKDFYSPSTLFFQVYDEKFKKSFEVMDCTNVLDKKIVVDMEFKIKVLWEKDVFEVVRSLSQIRDLFKYVVQFYFCHFFPSFPEISNIPKIKYNTVYFQEKGYMMEMFLNKMAGYKFFLSDEEVQFFFSSNYQKKNKKRSLVECTVEAIKDFSRKATTSLTEKLKSSISSKNQDSLAPRGELEELEEEFVKS